MESIIKSILIDKKSRKSKSSIIPNDLDSIRSTVLGKFYEGIIAKWLEEKEYYKFRNGKPSVYWHNILIPDKIDNSEEYKASLEKIIKDQKKKRTNSDGLFERGEKKYLWEAKNWPKWNQGCSDNKEQICKIFKETPWIFAKEVKHIGKNMPIQGIIFSWWNEFEGFKEFEDNISKIIEIEFKIYFTSNIIDDCRKEKYDWYIELVKEQQENLCLFFTELLGDSKL
ncbi:MAG: hypothetical protein HQK79_18155 [Desulfobacterales bacterium]|nr:hypothetical protein [Desulfobacterales bacterium]